VLLADEVVVIKEARKRGLPVTSTHLILEEAKRRNLIKSAKVELDGLIASGFRTTPNLIRETLRRVGEY
jgi:predicted nucleic acid-binding protein